MLVGWFYMIKVYLKETKLQTISKKLNIFSLLKSLQLREFSLEQPTHYTLTVLSFATHFSRPPCDNTSASHTNSNRRTVILIYILVILFDTKNLHWRDNSNVIPHQTGGPVEILKGLKVPKKNPTGPATMLEEVIPKIVL